MKFDALSELSEEELENKMGELKESYLKFRFQHATAQMDNTAKLKETRRDIARIETLKNQRKIKMEKSKAKASDGE